MNSDFRDKLSNAATVVEITLGMVILIACIVSGIGMVAMTDMNKLFGDPAYLQARMRAYLADREPDRRAVDRHSVRDPEVSVYFASGPPPQQEGDRGGHPRRGSRRGKP